MTRSFGAEQEPTNGVDPPETQGLADGREVAAMLDEIAESIGHDDPAGGPLDPFPLDIDDPARFDTGERLVETLGSVEEFRWRREIAGHSDEHPVTSVDDFGDEASMVRPYAWTGGRTRSNFDLQLETLVSTTEPGQDEARLSQVEHRTVGALCRHHPHSVAEVAAKLSIPLGVARVILSDMAELGLISIHRTFADDDIAAHLVLMERVLSGLRRL